MRKPVDHGIRPIGSRGREMTILTLIVLFIANATLAIASGELGWSSSNVFACGVVFMSILVQIWGDE